MGNEDDEVGQQTINQLNKNLVKNKLLFSQDIYTTSGKKRNALDIYNAKDAVPILVKSKSQRPSDSKSSLSPMSK
jgi:hypothetical protein